MQQPTRSTSALAVTSLICGILGWTLLPFLGAIVAIITGHLARGEIRREPDRYEGDGMALAGLVLGYLSLGLTLLAVVVFLLLIGGVAFLGMTA